jgi:hypothetical protein
MNRMWCNNAIICPVLRINWRYFSSKKDSLEIFNAYMQEVNISFIIFHSFYLHFRFGPDVCKGNFSFKICGVVPWHGGVRNIILFHKHTLYFLNTSLTTFLLTQPSIHMWHRHELRTTCVCWVLFQYTNMRYHFQYLFHDRESRISTL